jgi:uncharacterized phage-associated protein
MTNRSVSQIASTILTICKDRGIEVSNLKLQKLTYYAEAWYLAFEDSSLFDEVIEAWVHGPVVPQVFREYRGYRWSNIIAPIGAPSTDQAVIDHLNLVLDAYGKYTATELERLTHNEKPWIEARKGYPADEPSSVAISREVMREYYSSLVGQR